MAVDLSHTDYQRNLDENLVLRWSTTADQAAISDLYCHVFRKNADSPLPPGIPHLVNDLFNGQHPLIGPGDWAVVEDRRYGTLVAATCLLHATWEYEGLPFTIGRPELVASHPDYRHQGLIRAVFDLIHARSAARGQPVQGITGIPYYYRLFGYEYALDLGGGREVLLSAIPPLKDGERELYMLVDATLDDIPLISELYERERSRAAINAQVDAAYWRYLLHDQTAASREGWNILLIQDVEARPCGYLLLRRARWRNIVPIHGLAVLPDTPLTAVMPSVLRAVRNRIDGLLTYNENHPPADRIGLHLGRNHPAYEVLTERMAPRVEPPYAWYIRVADLPAFIRQIAPVLERRLATAAVAGYSGTLTLDFYRGGLQLTLENGRITAATDWRAPVWNSEAGAGFPPLVFSQLLFGYRSLAELRNIYPDVWADDTTRPVLEALFPQRAAWILPLD